MTDVIVIGGGHNGLVTGHASRTPGTEDDRARASPRCRRRRGDRRDPSGIQDLHAGAFRTPQHNSRQRARAEQTWPRADRSGSASVCAPARRPRARAWTRSRCERGKHRAVLETRCPALSGFLRRQWRAYETFVCRSAGGAASGHRASVAVAICGRCCRWAAGSGASGKKDAYRLLRWAPMSAADFVTEWFESEPLRAAIAAPGIFGAALGPRSAGSTAVLLDEDGGRRRNATPRSGRPRCVHVGAGGGRPRGRSRDPHRTQMSCASTCTAAEPPASRSVPETDWKRAAVVSNADPRRTIAGAGRSNRARAGVPRAHAELPLHRQRCEGEPGAESASRISRRLAEIRARLEGSSRSVQLSITWSARSTRRNTALYSTRPYIEITIPSLTDSALAPAGAHVMSITAQFAPYRLRDGIEWISGRGNVSQMW